MDNQKSRLAIIHLAKKQLGLDDEAYRAILSGAGVSSAKDIETDIQFNTIMGAFLRLGFLPSGCSGLKRKTVPGRNPDMISRPQEYYIKGLWGLASRAKDEKSLRRMVRRIGKVDDIVFLSRRNASALILALRDICWKAGFNPDSREGAYAVNGERGGGHAGHENSPGVLSAGNGGNRGNQARGVVAARTGVGGEL